MKRERLLVLLVIVPSVSLILTLSMLLREQKVSAEMAETERVLTAKELRIVDTKGRTRIRLLANEIRIFDPDGEVIWKAPPNEWVEDDSADSLEIYPGIGGDHWVQTVLEQGRIIILEDGSRWEVEKLNQAETVLWSPTSPITVAEANSPVGDFRYVLTNREEKEIVVAKYRGR